MSGPGFWQNQAGSCSSRCVHTVGQGFVGRMIGDMGRLLQWRVHKKVQHIKACKHFSSPLNTHSSVEDCAHCQRLHSVAQSAQPSINSIHRLSTLLKEHLWTCAPLASCPLTPHFRLHVLPVRRREVPGEDYAQERDQNPDRHAACLLRAHGEAQRVTCDPLLWGAWGEAGERNGRRIKDKVACTGKQGCFGEVEREGSSPEWGLKNACMRVY